LTAACACNAFFLLQQQQNIAIPIIMAAAITITIISQVFKVVFPSSVSVFVIVTGP
jgi:hypothetical protein